MIIALTGLPATGKNTVSEYLVKNYNFFALSFSSIILDELKKQGVTKPVRDDFKNKALFLRQTYGDGALAKLLVDKIKVKDPNLSKNYVLDGMRTMGEFNEIKKVGGQVWAITAPQQTRLNWIKTRGRDIDTTLTLEDLQKLDEKELFSSKNTKGDLSLDQTIKNADFTIQNNKGVKELYEKIMAEIPKLSL